tara:strand:- start:298 stop:462 length:165 start_codon:yes stop_codon:yes gene_type:complete
MNVIQLPTKYHKPNDPDDLWNAYVKAANKAQKTRHLEDGIEAGRAWSKFLRVFE